MAKTQDTLAALKEQLEALDKETLVEMLAYVLDTMVNDDDPVGVALTQLEKGEWLAELEAMPQADRLQAIATEVLVPDPPLGVAARTVARGPQVAVPPAAAQLNAATPAHPPEASEAPSGSGAQSNSPAPPVNRMPAPTPVASDPADTDERFSLLELD